MAQFVVLWESRERVVEGLVEAAREADSCRGTEYLAAVRIQSWFRGCRVRAYLSLLHHSATTIQRCFRGNLGRKLYRGRLHEAVRQMRRALYHKQAARIQSVWRGYYVRKYVFDYYAQKCYLEGLARKNEVVMEKLSHYWQKAEEESLQREEQEQELLSELEARKHHYMLSTQCMDGVFKPANRSEPLPFERRMRTVKFAASPKKHKFLQRGKQERRNLSLPVGKEEKEPETAVLPPRVQGPFRSSQEVWQQRTKPLNLTLRVSTAYDSVEVARAELKAEEWRGRIIDEKFLPFSRREQKYHPLLHTQSSYTKPAYGTKWFRDEQPSRSIVSEPFRTVIPPIPVFEKLNSTY